MKLFERFIDLVAWFLQGPRQQTADDTVPGRSPIASTNESSAMNELMYAQISEAATGTYLRVTHVGGVTLRMAGEIVRALQPLDAQITLIHAGIVADARSILSIVCMAAGYGARVYVWAKGPDTERAVEVLAKVFAGGFGVRKASL